MTTRYLPLLALLIIAVPAAAQDAPGTPAVAEFTAQRSIAIGQRVTVRGRIAPATRMKVRIERRRPNYTWEPIATLTSDAKGRFSARLPLRRSARLRASVTIAGVRQPGPQRRNVAVRRRAQITLGAREEEIAGRPTPVRGRVWPARPGEKVLVQAVRGRTKVNLTRLRVRPGGRVSGTVRLPSAGRWRLQLVARGRKGVDRTATARSAARTFHGRNPHSVPRSAPHYIVQARQEARLYYYERGQLVRVLPVVFGKPSTPTPVGSFRVYAKTPGPSVVFGPWALWYHGNYGIHGTNQEHLLREDWRYFSAGCTRNYNDNIVWLYERVPVGTPVRNLL